MRCHLLTIVCRQFHSRCANQHPKLRSAPAGLSDVPACGKTARAISPWTRSPAQIVCALLLIKINSGFESGKLRSDDKGKYVLDRVLDNCARGDLARCGGVLAWTAHDPCSPCLRNERGECWWIGPFPRTPKIIVDACAQGCRDRQPSPSMHIAGQEGRFLDGSPPISYMRALPVAG